MIGLSVDSQSQTDFITCPENVTDQELASIISSSLDELQAMKRARSLTNATICQLPKAKIARALKKTSDPSKPSIEGFMKWRNESLISGTGRTINIINADHVDVERQSLIINDGPIMSTDPALTNQ